MVTTRQVDAGKSYLLSNDTAAKLLKGLKKITSRSRSSNTDTNIVQIYNGSGSDVDPFKALTLSGSVFEEDQSEFFDEEVLEGDTLVEDSDNIVVLLEPIEAGGTGEGAVGGVVAVLVDVSDISHTHIAAGASGLVSATSGPLKIVSPPTANGEVYLKAVFGSPAVPAITNGMVHGLLQSDITDTTTQVDVNVTFSLLEDVSVGDIVTALNIIGYSGSLGGDAIVFYHGDGTGNEDGTYTLMGARCPS
jgi:hypothetical protein